MRIYRATAPDAEFTLDKTVANKPVNEDEILTIVMNNDRVTAVTASIDLSGEF
jgi:hypothetical protein